MCKGNRITAELRPGVPYFAADGPCRSLPKSGLWMT
jgi:hypothetical protein